jgi:hypothetical protein
LWKLHARVLLLPKSFHFSPSHRFVIRIVDLCGNWRYCIWLLLEGFDRQRVDVAWSLGGFDPRRFDFRFWTAVSSNSISSTSAFSVEKAGVWVSSSIRHTSSSSPCCFCASGDTLGSVTPVSPKFPILLLRKSASSIFASDSRLARSPLKYSLLSLSMA